MTTPSLLVSAAPFIKSERALPTSYHKGISVKPCTIFGPASQDRLYVLLVCRFLNNIAIGMVKSLLTQRRARPACTST